MFCAYCYWFQFSVSLLFTHTHTGEECELTCRESNNDVVILPSNMTVESVLKEYWRNPHKVKVSLSVCLCPPHSSDRRTSQSSVIHNSAVRNFAYSVYILALLPTMQNASLCLSFVPNALQIFVFEAWQPFKHFYSIFNWKRGNMLLPSCIPVLNMTFQEVIVPFVAFNFPCICLSQKYPIVEKQNKTKQKNLPQNSCAGPPLPA